MSETCSVCGAPMEHGVCPYCGATSTNQGQQGTPNQSFNQAPPYNQGPAYNQGTPYNQGQAYNQPYNYVPPVMGRPVISTKSRTAALLFCLLLGPLGIHYFYVGKVGMGILYLFTGGLCGLGILVNLIQILCGSFRDQFGYVVQQW